jgi:hypothetical protein
MAVFYDTGGGDIYAGPTREAVIAEMRSDIGDDDFIEKDVFEVDGDTKMRVEDENERPTGKLVTLAEAYVENLGAYCIASENC